MATKITKRQTPRMKAEEVAKDFIAQLRTAIADYKYAEGCSCCRSIEKHAEAESRIAFLLGVPEYSDGSGYDFKQFRSANKRKN